MISLVQTTPSLVLPARWGWAKVAGSPHGPVAPAALRPAARHSPAAWAALTSPAVATLSCSSPAAEHLLDTVSNNIALVTGIAGALLGALITVGFQPFLRAYWDVRVRATPGAIRRAARADLRREIDAVEAARRLPTPRIVKVFLHDLVAEEAERLREGTADTSLGRDAEIGTIFNAYLELGQTSLVITGATNSGATTLIRAVAREVAKRREGMPSLCPPTWEKGRLYSLRLDRLMAVDPKRRGLILMAILQISRSDPQMVKIVIDNRPLMADPATASLTATIFDATQRSRIGLVLAMTEANYQATLAGRQELKAHLRRLRLKPLPEAIVARIVGDAFLIQLRNLQGNDTAFATAPIDIPHPIATTPDADFVSVLAVECSTYPTNGDLGILISRAQRFAIHLYKLWNEAGRRGSGERIVVTAALAREFVAGEDEKGTPG